MADIDYEKLGETLRRVLGGGTGGSMAAGQSGMQPSGAEVKKLAEAAKNSANEFTKLRAGMRLTSKAQYDYQAAQRDLNRQLGEVEDTLERYRKGTIALSAEEKKLLEAERARLASVGDNERANQALQSGVTAVAGHIRNIGSQMIASQTAVASAIQSGASGFGIASAQLQASANIQNSVTQAFAGSMTAAGAAVMNFGIAGRVAGAAMMMYAQHMSVTSDLATQSANARTQILLSGGDALLKTYQEATRSGAVLADGFGQMQRSLQGSRYTVEDYTAIVKQSGEQLAATGLGVQEASMMIGRVGKVLKDTRMDRQMLALGIGYQEQGQLMAQVMADMRKRDPSRELNEREVALRTKQYAQDLAVLSAITGKDAKARQEESRKATSQLAFQQVLKDLGTKGEVVGKAMETMSPQIRQNVMELMTYGSVLNKNGAMLTATNPSLARMQQELADMGKKGILTNDNALKTQERYSKSINDGMMSNKGLALAMAAPESKLASLGDTAATVRDDIIKMGNATKVIAQVGEAAAKAGTKDEDKQTKLFNDMVELGQDIRKAFQDHIIKNLEKMGPMLNDVLNKIKAGLPMPGADAKNVVDRMIDEMIKIFSEASPLGKVLIGLTGAILALNAILTIGNFAKDLVSLRHFLTGKGGTMASGQLPGTGGIVPEMPGGQRGGNRSPIPGSPRNGGRLPSGAGAGIPNVGSSGDGLGKFGAGIRSILAGLGQGAGGLIEGVLTGIANGIKAFGNPAVLKGAAYLGGAIIVIGAAIAGASWLMGKSLPTLAEGMSQIEKLDGERLKSAGIGMGVVAAGLLAFSGTAFLSTLATGLTQLGDGILKFFHGKTTIEQFQEFAAVGPELKKGAEGISSFTKSMQDLLLLDIKKIDTLSEKLERLQKASQAPERGFFSSMGQAALGSMPDAIKAQIAKGEAMSKGGPTGVGQTAYLQGAAIVHLSQQTVTAIKSALGGGVVTAPAVPNSRPSTMSTSKPEERSASSGGLSMASLNTLAKSDPVIFALTQLLEVEKAKDRAADGQTSKVDIALKLMDRIAEDLAKQTGHQQEYTQWARKNVLLKK